MQDYIQLAEKNGVPLVDEGPCQFCGAKTTRGVHECVEIFAVGFQGIDFSAAENHKYRFFIVDAHTLQHPEIHGRWNNHFHLSRLHLQFHYNIAWQYDLSPILSTHLNRYKASKPDEYLQPPAPLQRGPITSSDIVEVATNEILCKNRISDWAKTVYQVWAPYHDVVDRISQSFINR